jgi:branched-chain amino acid transport system permease protein
VPPSGTGQGEMRVDVDRSVRPEATEPDGAAGPARRLADRVASRAWPSPWWSVAVLVVFTILGPVLLGDIRQFPVLVFAGLWGIMVVGLAVLSGWAGQLSLGQAAIFGIGAYGSAIAVVRWELPHLVGILFGIALTLAVALVAAAVLRLQGIYLALATLALGFLLLELFRLLPEWTGGNNGFPGIPVFELFGYEFDTDRRAFVLAWSVLTLAVAISINLIRSRFGRALIAIHDDEDAARALGIPAVRYKVLIWLYAATLASIGGSLYAHYVRFISPEQFGLLQSVIGLAAVVVGGNGSLFGPVFGILVLRLIPEFTQNIEFLTTIMVTGILLVVIMVAYPGGLADIWHRGLLRIVRWRQGGDHAPR